MSDIIRLLPDSVANQIAAGEVIQRPASVVKELVENAIDAGAAHIQVYITDAGRTSVQVIDDGKGMSETDARLSFERHATSKISAAADLFSLHTMGFRGEALASIAAVAEVELKTRLADEELGTRLLISGSEVQAQEPTACPTGSNFTVRNLFYNVPARRKFLKANSTELRNIVDEFQRIALVHPDLAFSLFANNSEMFHLPVTNIRQRILSIFGKKLNKDLLPLEVETTLCTITGFIGTPESARKNGVHQYFFVNGRYMYHPYFRKAVMEAYTNLIPTGEQVSYFIYFEVDPAQIDVNIHPTKTEIKFENDVAIWQILSATVKESLGKSSSIPSIDFDTEDSPDFPAFQPNALYVAPPRVQVDTSFNPFHTPSGGGAPKPSVNHWEDLYLPSEKEAFTEPAPVSSTSVTASPEQLSLDMPQEASSEKYLLYKGRYILTPVTSGLMVIDQHRAHVRVLFDQYLEQIRSKHGVAQGVLFPDIVQLTVSEVSLLEMITDDISAIGFELTSLGGGSYAINGIPSGIDGLKPAELIQNMLHAALEQGAGVREEIQNMLALTLARAAAIVYGQVLTTAEISSLLQSLFTSAAPNYTPDGLPVLSIIGEDEIAKLFKRG
jgi:DNA mismatch repair protein MutL